MSVTIPILTNLTATGSPSNENLNRGKGIIARITTVGCLALTLGTGATQIVPNNWFTSSEATLTESQLYQNKTTFLESFFSAHEQLTQIKQQMGLNILELAMIFQVSRPTVYKWLESKEGTIRKKNQIRLKSIYEICKIWNTKNLGRLGSYLHKPIGMANISLFSLLKNNILNLDEINSYINNIAQTIVQKRQIEEAHELLLKQHAFEPTKKEDMEDRLIDIDFLD